MSTQPGAALSHYEGHKLIAPLLYLSSAHVGWDELVAEVFHEPYEMTDVMVPPTTDIVLILFRGGALRFAHRVAHGPWHERRVGERDLLLRGGTAAPYEVRWRSLATTPTQTLHLRLPQERLMRTAAELGGSAAAPVSLIVPPDVQDPLLVELGFALWRELEQGAPQGRLYAHTAAQLLAVHLLRQYGPGARITEPSHTLTPQQMARLTDFVDAFLAEDLSLAALAAQTGFSPYHFARLFRRTTGQSPHQWLLRRRIARAQQLLRSATLPLAQVGLSCGFANQSHFTQVFKRQLGLTPRAYRQAYGISAGLQHDRTEMEDSGPPLPLS